MSGRVLVVYESMFGNTQRVAKAIGQGLAESARTDVIEVGTAPVDLQGCRPARRGRAHSRVQSQPSKHPRRRPQAGRRPGGLQRCGTARVARRRGGGPTRTARSGLRHACPASARARIGRPCSESQDAAAGNARGVRADELLGGGHAGTAVGGRARPGAPLGSGARQGPRRRVEMTLAARRRPSGAPGRLRERSGQGARQLAAARRHHRRAA